MKTLTMQFESMARFTCGPYTIERGPGDAWRFVTDPAEPPAKHTLEDLHALAAAASTASRWQPTESEE